MGATIYIATHKIVPFPEGYIPVHNGKAVSQDLGVEIMGDDVGDNISARVATFSECCTLFWMWKHATADVVGLAHYRRYFRPHCHHVPVENHLVASTEDFSTIGDVDIIVPEPFDFADLGVSLLQQYIGSHVEKDIYLMRSAVSKLFPSYTETCDHVLSQNALTPWNIFVGKREVMSDYCSFLFPVMFQLEGWISTAEYTPYQARVFAFLSERLFTVWVAHNERGWNITRRPVMALPYATSN